MRYLSIHLCKQVRPPPSPLQQTKSGDEGLVLSSSVLALQSCPVLHCRQQQTTDIDSNTNKWRYKKQSPFPPHFRSPLRSVSYPIAILNTPHSISRIAHSLLLPTTADSSAIPLLPFHSTRSVTPSRSSPPLSLPFSFWRVSDAIYLQRSQEKKVNSAILAANIVFPAKKTSLYSKTYCPYASLLDSIPSSSTSRPSYSPFTNAL